MTSRRLLYLVACTACDDLFRPTLSGRLCACGKVKATELSSGAIEVTGFTQRLLGLPWEAYDGSGSLCTLVPVSAQELLSRY
jgi:hypothetical protein